uniref:Uncharacterized protein n=1 Tax=Anopheles minimus TaxID=112268 RepID=A0A182VTU0_9DIPT
MASRKSSKVLAENLSLTMVFLFISDIKPNIIAMGYPAENMEAIYRNNREDVLKFLTEKHEGKYKVYNLCSERTYDPKSFPYHAEYPFKDHNPPDIELIDKFCKDVYNFLNADRSHVVAIHCKAGKGRTGTMICCYMLYNNTFNTANEALTYYGEKRTKDKKGVTIPSQRRYVEYYEHLLRNNLTYRKVSLYVLELRIFPADLPLKVGSIQQKDMKEPLPLMKFRRMEEYISVELDCCMPLAGDVKVEFRGNKLDKGWHFWFNTFFVELAGIYDPQGRLVLTLDKKEIDDAHKGNAKKCPEQVRERSEVVNVTSVEDLTDKGTSGGGSGKSKLSSSSPFRRFGMAMRRRKKRSLKLKHAGTGTNSGIVGNTLYGSCASNLSGISMGNGSAKGVGLVTSSANDGGGASSKRTKLKFRWLRNMRSDPNLKETLAKSVQLRTTTMLAGPGCILEVAKGTTITSNVTIPKSPTTTSKMPIPDIASSVGAKLTSDIVEDMKEITCCNLPTDYYSFLCDNQLSYESPGKSPGHLMRLELALARRPSTIEEVLQQPGPPTPPPLPPSPSSPAAITVSDTDCSVVKPRASNVKIGFNSDRQLGDDHRPGDRSGLGH